MNKLTGEEPLNPTGLYGQQDTPGITLRAYLTAQALTGLSHYSRLQDDNWLRDEAIADSAITIADTVIAMLNNKPNPNAPAGTTSTHSRYPIVEFINDERP